MASIRLTRNSGRAGAAASPSACPTADCSGGPPGGGELICCWFLCFVAARRRGARDGFRSGRLLDALDRLRLRGAAAARFRVVGLGDQDRWLATLDRLGGDHDLLDIGSFGNVVHNLEERLLDDG